MLSLEKNKHFTDFQGLTFISAHDINFQISPNVFFRYRNNTYINARTTHINDGFLHVLFLGTLFKTMLLLFM